MSAGVSVLPPLAMIPGDLLDIVLTKASHPAEVSLAILRSVRGLEASPVPREDAAIYAVVLAASVRILTNYRCKVARNPRTSTAQNAPAQAQNATPATPTPATAQAQNATPATPTPAPAQAQNAPTPATPAQAQNAPTPDECAAVDALLDAAGEQGSKRSRATFTRLVRAVGAGRARDELNAFLSEARAGERVRNRGAALVARLRRIADHARAATAQNAPATAQAQNAPAPIQPPRMATPATVATPLCTREDYEAALAEGDAVRALMVLAARSSNDADLIRAATMAMPPDIRGGAVARWVDDLLAGRVLGRAAEAFADAANEAVRLWREERTA